jgi:hypothetical protein
VVKRELNACSLVGKREGKRPLRRPRHKWEDSIEICFQEVD